MNEVVSQCHLVLLLCLVEIAINHLQNCILSIDLSVMVLLVDLHFFFELFGLGHSHDFPPMSQDLHPVEVSHLLFLEHCIFKVIPPHLHLCLLLIEIFDGLVLMPDLDESPFLVSCRGSLAFHKFT